MPFYNYELDKKGCPEHHRDCHLLLGRDATLAARRPEGARLQGATRAGLSFGKDDMKHPADEGAILEETQKEVEKVDQAFQKGIITEGERYLKIIDLWTHARERIGEDMMQELRERHDEKTGRTSTRSSAWSCRARVVRSSRSVSSPACAA
jgi:DNA-directed RNA polymerase subunit beta'